MAFDFVILIFTSIVLGRFRQSGGLSGLLFRDGLIYFLVTSMCNTIPAVSRSMPVTTTMSQWLVQVLNLLNLNGELPLLLPNVNA